MTYLHGCNMSEDATGPYTHRQDYLKSQHNLYLLRNFYEKILYFCARIFIIYSSFFCSLDFSILLFNSAEISVSSHIDIRSFHSGLSSEMLYRHCLSISLPSTLLGTLKKIRRS
jgi:hypothetical protein